MRPDVLAVLVPAWAISTFNGIIVRANEHEMRALDLIICVLFGYRTFLAKYRCTGGQELMVPWRFRMFTTF